MQKNVRFRFHVVVVVVVVLRSLYHLQSIVDVTNTAKS